MEPFINFVIRPPRADYTVADLLESEFSLKGCAYQRKDVEISNNRGQLLKCSHYMPVSLPEDVKLPCVIYCHGNSGCRADGNEAAVVLLPSNITVFTLDFSGSGLSDGDFVSLGWNEKDDLKAVVTYLRSLKKISCIGLWGRSMGAVTSLLYGAEDPSIAGMVLDSPFSNLFDLMMELVDVYKIRLPKFTIRVAVKIMRRIIQKRAQFDIMDMNMAQHASKTFIPALFGHAIDDIFIPPHHSDIIHREYAGDKNIIKFEGDHNSSRPQFYYDSVAIFFYNILCPPTQLHAEETCNLLEYTLPSLQEVAEHSVYQLLDEPAQDSGSAEGKGMMPQQTMRNNFDETNLQGNVGNTRDCNDNNLDEPLVESRETEHNGEFSYPSSNGASTEGWGRCSSHGISENSAAVSPVKQNSADIPLNDDDEKMILRAMSAFKGVDPSNADKRFQEDCGTITPRRKSRFDALSRRLGRFNCFRGTEI